MIKAIINAKKFHNYFEMPIQHISDKMLKVMRRGSGSKTIKHQLSIMKEAPDAFFRTSVIVGHPKESEEDFRKIKEFIDEFGFDRVSIFEYSDEEGTHSYKIEEKVDKKTIKRRVEELEKIVSKNLQNSLKKDVGKVIDVVLTGESSEGEFFLGAKKLLWAEDIDGEILINENETEQTLEVGKIYKAEVTEVVGENLLAKIIK
jgi:tRNA A37 methylthiotransferase MiaB